MELDEETRTALGLARLDDFDAAVWFGERVERNDAAQRERYRRIKQWRWERGPDGTPRRVPHTVRDAVTRCANCREVGHTRRTCLRPPGPAVAPVPPWDGVQRCSGCREPGHNRRCCPVLYPIPPERCDCRACVWERRMGRLPPLQ